MPVLKGRNAFRIKHSESKKKTPKPFNFTNREVVGY